MVAALHALLLTDVVDSTQLTERLHDAEMAALWTAHDRLARDLIVQWDGREIDKTDGMLVLFDEVAQAVGYALAYHEALRSHGLPIRARAGVHWGPVSLRPNPAADIARGAKPIEVEGIALPAVARLMHIAGGGQTLLSADARLALAVVPQRLQSHGHWMLHGISQPMEVFEIVEGDAPFAMPPDADKAYRVIRNGDLWHPVRDLRHNLPAERDGFVGRQHALEILARMLSTGSRLISVLGTAGAGKTRLAIRLAWTQLSRYPGGIWFSDLSQARGTDGIHFAVAQGLEIALGRIDPVVQLGRAIAGRGRCLVILDNFEQVSAYAETTLGKWLDRAPLAQFIVTTREVLGIVGEELFAIPELAADDAVALFLKRAKAARHTFAPNDDDRTAIAQLVKVLDHLPLSIELAAARVRIMPPRNLLERMNDRFDLLLSHAGRRDRQATLRAAFDWSWDLLSDPEKRALARLSVFEGGFTLDASSVVIDANAGSEGAVNVDLVQRLVDKSFVRQVSDLRFDLLESVRDYASQHLRAAGRFEHSGPACETDARTRHWRHFATIGDRVPVVQLCAEISNLIAACRAAAAVGDALSATACLVSAWSALRVVGPYRAAVELAAAVEAIPALSVGNRAWCRWVIGNALDMLGEVDASRLHIEQGLLLAAEAHDPKCTARLLIVLGSRQITDGDFERASTSLLEALRLSDTLGDRPQQAIALNLLGRLMDHQSRFREARTFYEKALALARVLSDRRTEGGLLGNLAGLHRALGEQALATSHYEESLAIAVEVGDRHWEGNARCNLGLLYQEQQKNDGARSQFELALATASGMGDVRLAYTVLCNLGILLTAEGRFNEAAQRLDLAVKGAVASSDRRSEGQFRGYLALALANQALLPQAREVLDRGESLLLAAADRLSYGLILCHRAEVETLAENAEAAHRALMIATDIADALTCGPDSELRRRLAAVGPAPHRC